MTRTRTGNVYAPTVKSVVQAVTNLSDNSNEENQTMSGTENVSITMENEQADAMEDVTESY